MKKFILGFISCAGLFLMLGAATQLTASPNQFPVTFDGKSVSMEAYNINGSTYFKLRDIGSIVGFNVDFVNDTIAITTGTKRDEGNNTPTTPSTPVNSGKYELPIVTADSPHFSSTVDGVRTELINGAYYIYKDDIEDKLKAMGHGNRYGFGVRSFWDWDNSIKMLDDIPVFESNNMYVPMWYYYDILLPLLESL